MSHQSAIHDLKTLVLSFHSLLAIETVEEERARSLLIEVASDLRQPFYEWSVTEGLRGLRGATMDMTQDALMALKNVNGVHDLKGKRIGVSQIGDAPYNYTVGLIGKAGLTKRDVQWIPVGADVSARAAALVSARVDATMLTAPVYFKLETEGYKNFGNISDYEDIYAPSVYLFRKATVARNPKLPELLMKAHAEAIRRFYDDKAFAIKAYLPYDKQELADLDKVYDYYAKISTYERVPYIPAAAVKYVLDHPADDQVAAQLRAFDFRKVIDNSLVDRLVREGFFQQLFGPSIQAEEDRKAKLAFR